MDGDLGATGETPVDFVGMFQWQGVTVLIVMQVEAWNDFIKTNDLINANTGQFDPRHM